MAELVTLNLKATGNDEVSMLGGDLIKMKRYLVLVFAYALHAHHMPPHSDVALVKGQFEVYEDLVFVDEFFWKNS